MKCFCVHRERVPPFYGLVGHIGVPDDLRGTRRAVCQCLCDQCGLLRGTALVQKMFSRSTDDIPDGYRRRTRQELEKLYENKASVRHGGADFFGLRPYFVGNAGLTPCIPTVLTLRYSGRLSRPLF